jgi:Invasion protein B, involved in pathogenesis
MGARETRNPILLIMLGFCLASGTARGQDAAPAQADPAKPQNAWVVNCSTGMSGTAFECQMSQNLTASNTGQRVLTVTIRKNAADGGMAMLFALPHGLFLPAGASYQIDAGAKAQVAIQTSDQNGAYAAVPMDDKLIGALKAGTTLNVGMESVGRKEVVIPVSLAGFTAAIDKLASLK